MTPFVHSLLINSPASNPIGGERVFLCTPLQRYITYSPGSMVLILSISTGYCVPWQRDTAEKFTQQFNRTTDSSRKLARSKWVLQSWQIRIKLAICLGKWKIVNSWFYLSLGQRSVLSGSFRLVTLLNGNVWCKYKVQPGLKNES